MEKLYQSVAEQVNGDRFDAISPPSISTGWRLSLPVSIRELQPNFGRLALAVVVGIQATANLRRS